MKSNKFEIATVVAVLVTTFVTFAAVIFMWGASKESEEKTVNVEFVSTEDKGPGMFTSGLYVNFVSHEEKQCYRSELTSYEYSHLKEEEYEAIKQLFKKAETYSFELDGEQKEAWVSNCEGE